MVDEIVGVEVIVGNCILVGVELDVGVLVVVGNCIIAGEGLGAAVPVKDGFAVGTCEEIVTAEGVKVKVGTPFVSGWA